MKKLMLTQSLLLSVLLSVIGSKFVNAEKPTPRTRHIDIKYFSLAEWVEHDLLMLERVDTSQNMADHFTKQLGPLAFSRHTDYLMGRVPPTYARAHNLLRNKLDTKLPPISLLPKSFSKDIPKSPPVAAAAARFVASWARVLGLLSQ